MSNSIQTPDPLATWKKIKSDEYGLSMATLISKEWFNGEAQSTNCEYSRRRDWIREMRLFSRGEHDDQEYKDHISRQDGDLDWLNLDWTFVNFAEKFNYIVANGISDEYYKFDITAIDRKTAEARQDKIKMHKRNMLALPYMKQAKELFGIDLIPKDFVPQDEEGIELHNKLKERPTIDEAEELTIEYIKDLNNYEEIEKIKNLDLTIIGISAARVWTDPVNGIKVGYTDPEQLIHSFVKRNNFSDANYFGEFDTITIQELVTESDLKDADLREIAKIYAGKQNAPVRNYDTCLIEDLFNTKVDILRFAFKASKTEVHKAQYKKGKLMKVSKKDEDFEPKEGPDYDKMVGKKLTWMEGNHIIGSKYIYNYQECENIVRDEIDNPYPPYIVRATNIYNNKLRSFTSNIKPLAKQMQFIHLKVQHLIAEIKPDLVEIDIDALADLTNDGKGKKEAVWSTALNMMNVKGVIFKKRVDMGEMGLKESTAARPMAIQQGSGLTPLLNAWAHYYNLVRDTTGINPARDGSLPHDSLLGVNQMAQLASNTVTKHIVDASVDFNKRVFKTISVRIHRIYGNEKASHLREQLERAVGKKSIEAMESMKDRALHDFGFVTQMLPTQEELKKLGEYLVIALNEQSIDVDIAAEVENYAKISVKTALRYLSYMRKQRRKELMEEKQADYKAKSQADIASNQNATQMRMQERGTEFELEVQAYAKKKQIDVISEQALITIRDPEKQKDFERQVFIEQIKNAADLNTKKYLEDRKDDRTGIQATQQSAIADQRKKEGSKPINFDRSAFNNIFNPIN